MPETTIKDNVKQLLSDLPAPIKTFLVEKLDGIAKALTAKYQLHVDQGSVLQRDLMLVLLGAREPGALATNLRDEAHLDAPTLTALLNDVNAQIFMPLRAELESEETEAPVSKLASAATSASLPGVSIVKPTIPPNMPTMSTPMQDKVLNRLAPAGTMPAPVPTPMPRVTAPAPANLPGVILPKPMLPQAVAPASIAPPPAPAPKVMPTTMPALPPAAPVVAKPPTPVAPPAQPPAKSYAVDPYREQPEAHEK